MQPKSLKIHFFSFSTEVSAEEKEYSSLYIHLFSSLMTFEGPFHYCRYKLHFKTFYLFFLKFLPKKFYTHWEGAFVMFIIFHI